MDTIQIYQRRRRLIIRFALPIAVIGFLGFFTVMVFARNAIWSGLATIAFFIIALVGMVLCNVLYRCPECKWTLADDGEKNGEGGIVWNPSRCPNCGAKLKRGN